jgi:trehalose-6-phosphatase
MQIKFRLKQLDSHAHIVVFIDSTRSDLEENHWIRAGELVMRASEYAPFKEALNTPTAQTWVDHDG